jgi:DNA-binding transcriptional LysR family regulator
VPRKVDEVGQGPPNQRVNFLTVHRARPHGVAIPLRQPRLFCSDPGRDERARGAPLARTRRHACQLERRSVDAGGAAGRHGGRPPGRLALLLRQAALAGLGVTALPCYLGNTTPGLVRLRPEPIGAMETALWVLTHEDLRRTTRVSAFTDFIAQALGRKRPILEGAEPLPDAPGLISPSACSGELMCESP